MEVQHWKNRMTTQNRQKSNAKIKNKKMKNLDGGTALDFLTGMRRKKTLFQKKKRNTKPTLCYTVQPANIVLAKCVCRTIVYFKTTDMCVFM